MSTMEELKAQGNEAFKGRNFDKAIKLYTAAINVDSESENAALCYSNRAAAYQSKKMWVESENDAAQCVKLKPGFTKGWVRLALAQQKQGMFIDARSTLERGLELHPTDESIKKALEKAIARVEKENNRKNMTALTGQAVNQELIRLTQEQETHRTQLLQCSGKIKGIEKELKVSVLTKKELGKVSNETNTYRAVGKMFLHSSKSDTSTWLDKNETELKANLKSLQVQQNYLMKKMKESENNLREQMKLVRGR